MRGVRTFHDLITSELRKTARSVAYNIAEGHRRASTLEYIRFLDIAHGSAAELETQLFLSRALSYVDEQGADVMIQRLLEVERMLTGLKQSLRRRLSRPTPSRRLTPNPYEPWVHAQPGALSKPKLNPRNTPRRTSPGSAMPAAARAPPRSSSERLCGACSMARRSPKLRPNSAGSRRNDEPRLSGKRRIGESQAATSLTVKRSRTMRLTTGRIEIRCMCTG